MWKSSRENGGNRQPGWIAQHSQRPRLCVYLIHIWAVSFTGSPPWPASPLLPAHIPSQGGIGKETSYNFSLLLEDKSKFTSYRRWLLSFIVCTKEGVYLHGEARVLVKAASFVSTELPVCWPFDMGKATHGSSGGKNQSNTNLVRPVLLSKVSSFWQISEPELGKWSLIPPFIHSANMEWESSKFHSL